MNTPTMCFLSPNHSYENKVSVIKWTKQMKKSATEAILCEIIKIKRYQT